MGNSKVVADTSIFIEHLRAKDKTKTTLYNLAKHSEVLISSVTLYELLIGATTEEKMQDVYSLTGDLLVLPFSKSVAMKASELYHLLRKENKMIEFRDIFIAATCIIKRQLKASIKSTSAESLNLKLHSSSLLTGT